MSHDYFETFIAVADDCSTDTAKLPADRGSSPTVAQLQFDMIHDAPFTHTMADVLFEVWLVRQKDIEASALATDEKAELRSQFFSKGQPCLRTSPLAKTHGWGFLFDADGKVAMYAQESAEYASALANPELTQTKAMRSKRAT